MKSKTEGNPFLFSSKSKKKKKKQRRNNKENASSDEDETAPVDEEGAEQQTEVLPEPTSTTDKKKKGKSTTDEVGTFSLSKSFVTLQIFQISETPIILQCFVCKEEFSSRNVLFKHIKDMNHAKPIEVTSKSKKK